MSEIRERLRSDDNEFDEAGCQIKITTRKIYLTCQSTTAKRNKSHASDSILM